MKSELAEYILILQQSLESTHQAKDRSLYTDYLANAAVLLAMAEKGISDNIFKKKVTEHDRLLGNTWLEGPEHKKILAAWAKINESA